VHPQDQTGQFGGLSDPQNASFKFDALHCPTSNSLSIHGNSDHLEVVNTLNSGTSQLQSLFNAADGQPHDSLGHIETTHTGDVQLSHLNFHQHGIFHP
jgi:hypothetical protein